MNHWKSLEKL